MTLSKILADVRVSKMYQTMYGQMVVTHDVEVGRLRYDSRAVGRSDVFVALQGSAADGHRFVQNAIERGAKVVVLENEEVLPDSLCMHTGVVKVVVPDTRVALAQMSANYFDHPSRKLTAVGITGTNGKTTTSHLVRAILEESGSATGLIGTIEYWIGTERIPATHTTPESLELNELLAKMVASDCRAVVMEVSSHALDQHRVHGIRFSAAVFTNLTQDHLDYHGTMDRYFEAKSVLFRSLPEEACGIINLGDPYGSRMLAVTAGRTVTYAMAGDADIRLESVSLSLRGTELVVGHRGERMMIRSPLIGSFNAANILAAVGTGIGLGVPYDVIVRAIGKTPPVRGRFEPVAGPAGSLVVIDYAHTPDALEKALNAVNDIFDRNRRGKIITVFGCGGNRDATKRPIMGRIATMMSDMTIVTSDNPRNEDPDAIIRDIAAGAVAGKTLVIEPDREQAIRRALAAASAGDVVLIAGKGHEEYQIDRTGKHHFNDREAVERFHRQSG
ncbi:MAG TPA: UDP-N-acetylmuramoyl-L-alanyl-D-glutamate--2,6-diaminopimelate ligase [Bacteroidota bacterium]|nr:UDP-N-acetylmuramoyl-L-alanyl-D-glutamate--2,6-diaminopimelate ligase [Bacteroidota bacterium]